MKLVGSRHVLAQHLDRRLLTIDLEYAARTARGSINAAIAVKHSMSPLPDIARKLWT
jgi:hypothetical protein